MHFIGFIALLVEEICEIYFEAYQCIYSAINNAEKLRKYPVEINNTCFVHSHHTTYLVGFFCDNFLIKEENSYTNIVFPIGYFTEMYSDFFPVGILSPQIMQKIKNLNAMKKAKWIHFNHYTGSKNSPFP